MADGTLRPIYPPGRGPGLAVAEGFRPRLKYAYGVHGEKIDLLYEFAHLMRDGGPYDYTTTVAPAFADAGNYDYILVGKAAGLSDYLLYSAGGLKNEKPGGLGIPFLARPYGDLEEDVFWYDQASAHYDNRYKPYAPGFLESIYSRE